MREKKQVTNQCNLLNKKEYKGKKQASTGGSGEERINRFKTNAIWQIKRNKPVKNKRQFGDKEKRNKHVKNRCNLLDKKEYTG